jgi:predicted RNase H-like HicB family nuclease
VHIYWSDEDELFLAEVPELPGCLTHGTTISEAARSAEEAIEGWVETAEELGRPVPAPTTVRHYRRRQAAPLPLSPRQPAPAVRKA